MNVNIPDKMFKVPEDKLTVFLNLLNYILSQKEVDNKTLLRLVGKAVSFSIAVPNSILFCREAYSLITQAEQKGKDVVLMNEVLTEELSQFKFLESNWNGSSWRNPAHTAIKIFTDAAKLRWMGKAEAPEGVYECGSELGPELLGKDIHEKEAAGLLETLESLPEHILTNRWVEIFVDNQVLLYCYLRGGSKSPFIRNILKKIFHLQRRLNFEISIKYINTTENPADLGTRYSELGNFGKNV
eukprot:Lithocolla_globosa_v1_NODE_7763_length_903_cov_8.913915.p1 type:complete len:242 gc:universal NODE_7763_length_903_cov_8.913915:146-871(+)